MVVVMIVVSILTLKDAYRVSLEQEFATKQPHITIEYVEDFKIVPPKEQKQFIKQLKEDFSMIDEVSAFVIGKKFFSVTGYKVGGNAQYSGDVKLIGIDPQRLVYDFYGANFIKRDPFGVDYTPAEFLVAFAKGGLSVFNSSFFHSFFPVIESTEKFLFDATTQKYSVRLGAIFQDYDKEAILYTTIANVNQMLQQPSYKIDGFFVNAKRLEDIQKLTQALKEYLPTQDFIVSSWLQKREKQHMMFQLFESLSFLIVVVIVLLAVLFILLLLYHAIVKKSYQLSVLFTIGYFLQKEIFLVLVLSVVSVDLLLVGFIYFVLPYIVSYAGFGYEPFMIKSSLSMIIVLSLVFVLISYILIAKSYEMKTKSVF